MSTTRYIVDNQSEQTINNEPILRPYKVYTALVTQNGTSTEDTINAGTLTIGVTYFINQEATGMDFTNVGAPNNVVGTYFVATGTTPNSWGSGRDYTLGYDAGAPVVTVLENTIGNIWFNYVGVGRYRIESTELFTQNKTYITMGSNVNGANDVPTSFITDNPNSDDVLLYSWQDLSSKGGNTTLRNDTLLKTVLEIRVYNSPPPNNTK
jgi:hypothetical protein